MPVGGGTDAETERFGGFSGELGGLPSFSKRVERVDVGCRLTSAGRGKVTASA